MNSNSIDPSVPMSVPRSVLPSFVQSMPSLCWGAIIGGTIAAIGVHILLTSLGLSAGLATFTPMTDAQPVANFSVGAAIVWTICALVALAFGGFVAGRFSESLHSGFVHGILVWSLTLILTVLLLSMGTGMILGGAMKVLGEGLGIGGKAVASGLGDVTKDGLKQASDQLTSFIDEGVQSGSTNAATNSVRAKRELGFAVTKLFAPGNNVSAVDNRNDLIKALTNYSGMNEQEATKKVDDWTASYKSLKAESERIKDAAEQKARLAADRAAHNLSVAAIWSFIALLLGLVVTAFSARYGAKSYLRSVESIYHEPPVVPNQPHSKVA